MEYVIQKIPILQWLPEYKAHATNWIYVISEAIAYSQTAGFAPQAGLLTACGGFMAYVLEQFQCKFREI